MATEFKLIKQSDLRYCGINYSYDRTSCTGRCYDYCRCTEIINCKISDTILNSYYIAATTCKPNLQKNLKFYCLERVINALLRKNKDCISVSITGGYYGQETNGIYLEDAVLNEINEFIKIINDKNVSTTILVESALKAEYGYILPAIANKDWSMDDILINNIIPNSEQYRNTNPFTVKEYSESGKALTCLCKKVAEDKYLLVDGYHRFNAANSRKDEYMTVMWCDA